MINFPRSSFTWKAHPWQADPYYKWTGGFVGEHGQAYHVRFTLESRCLLRDRAGNELADLFMGAPCRSEYTIASENLFQVPSGEWRMAFSRSSIPVIAKWPSTEKEMVQAQPLAGAYQDYTIDIRSYEGVDALTAVGAIVDSTLACDAQNARSVYIDEASGIEVELEYPVNVMNLNQADGEFQVCTGPVLLPDLATWDGSDVHRVFVAHAAFSRFDRVEFILRRPVAAAPQERQWLDAPRGRDRLQLIDPGNKPPGDPPSRPQPLVYNETWDLSAQNAILRAD
ncbi:MAG TPA: hypothetical protein EYQ18_08730 [Candidatus Handelsmanbacteria bacterium]|nr:hypothetical protein [Candidatus Handelsmanbacteria bacterium]